jgi:hypothetical protein
VKEKITPGESDFEALFHRQGLTSSSPLLLSLFVPRLNLSNLLIVDPTYNDPTAHKHYNFPRSSPLPSEPSPTSSNTTLSSLSNILKQHRSYRRSTSRV